VQEANVVMAHLLDSSPRSSLNVYIELARLYAKRGRPDKVREVLGVAKRVILGTRGSDLDWSFQAATLLWQTTDYVDAKQFATDALEGYRKELEANPASQWLYAKTGFCYLVLGELASAQVSFQQFTDRATPDDRLSVISELQEFIDAGIVPEDAKYVLDKTFAVESSERPNAAPAVKPVYTAPKDTNPPTIVIQEPKDARGIKIIETQKYAVQVSGLAADENGVSAVYVNGIVANLRSPTSAEISESGLSGKVVKFAAEAMLAVGENTVDVRAVDVNGNQAKDLFKIRRAAFEQLGKKEDKPAEPKLKLPQIWAVVVGISEYQNKELQLSFAHKDAQAYYSFLKSPYGGAIPDERIELLTNRNATRADIIRAMNEKLRMAFEDDMVIVYIASHGVPEEVSGELYFLGYDADAKNIAGTAISQIDVQKAISTARAKKIVFIADACHSGSVGLSSNISRRASVASFVNRLLKEIAAARDGVAILTASSSNEFSQEGAQWGGHGVFTCHLVNGLKGEADNDGDGYVTIRELYEYVYRKVVDDTGGKQHPDLQGKFDNNLPVSVVR